MNKMVIAAAMTGLTLAGAGIGLVNADTSSNTNTSSNVQSGIAGYTMQEERLNAVAEVLGTTPSQLEDTLKTETMQQVISNAGLTPATFRQKVKTQLQSDLQAKGYSQTQITAAMNHHGMHGMGMHHGADSDADDQNG